MSLYLGNLGVKEIQHRAGVEFPDELVKFMSETKQDNANNIAPGKWHCFDIPFVLVCGDMDTAKEIYRHLSPFSDKFAVPLQISLQH